MPKRLIVILAIIGLLFSFESQAYSTFSNGTLVKGSGPEVYVLEHGIKRWIPNPAIFKNLFYDWGKIKKVADDMLNSFPNGNNMGKIFSDGALLKSDKSPKVYLYDNGKLRWVTDPNIFNSNDFSWENITVIPDNKIKTLKVSADVKSGEFLLLPATFITVKPPKETDIKKVTFSYSGVNPTGPVSELTWETFLDGYDAAWQGAYSKYTRTIDLPAVNKTYTFYARSRNKDGKIDSRPASYTFKTIDFSSLYNQLKISSVTRKAVPELNENIKITNSSKTSIDITGLVVKNQKNETAYLPKAVEVLYLQAGDLAKNLILEPGKTVIIFSGPSPAGKNFRLNKCAGYLNYYYNFLPRIREECPKPIEQELAGFNRNCRDYVKNLKACAPPNTADIKVTYDSQCANYLISAFNYSNCVARYQIDPDFLKNDWYIYLNRSSGFWNDLRDEAKLLDKDGNLIDSYSY
ncbi:lamin tail domain-containing protein [Patescibacteria group bacterium]|nr:lamin tail domain-containing protein [Patescibacteria group bacterium]MBU4580446.1 lamin tail domain-containing protein [Patescibacteria group bacterium]